MSLQVYILAYRRIAEGTVLCAMSEGWAHRGVLSDNRPRIQDETVAASYPYEIRPRALPLPPPPQASCRNSQ